MIRSRPALTAMSEVSQVPMVICPASPLSTWTVESLCTLHQGPPDQGPLQCTGGSLGLAEGCSHDRLLDLDSLSVYCQSWLVSLSRFVQVQSLGLSWDFFVLVLLCPVMSVLSCHVASWPHHVWSCVLLSHVVPVWPCLILSGLPLPCHVRLVT